jgi:hypothetical protein
MVGWRDQRSIGDVSCGGLVIRLRADFRPRRIPYRKALPEVDTCAPKTGRVLATIPAPGGGNSGLAWAEGTLWVGQYSDRKIHQVDPETGAILRTIGSNRFVTGVTWLDGELWHATWEGDESDLRRVDHRTGEVLERLEMPPGVNISGLESDDRDRFFCGGGKKEKSGPFAGLADAS